jgi:hypothetical protein
MLSAERDRLLFQLHATQMEKDAEKLESAAIDQKGPPFAQPY